MDDFSTDGVWWLPEIRDRHVPGRLTFGSDGVELVLQGALREFVPIEGEIIKVGAPDWQITPIVHGRTNDRRDVTLIQVGGLSLAGPFDDVQEVYRVDFALVGCHAGDDAFVETRIEFDLLDAWANPPSLPSSSEDRASVRVRTEMQEMGKAEINAGTIALVSGVSGTVGDAAVHLDRSTQFVVTLKQPTPARVILDSIVRPLSDLLVTTLGRPIGSAAR